MLSEDSIYGGWPASGEMDIMEQINNVGVNYCSQHFGDAGPGIEASEGGKSCLPDFGG